MDLPDVEANDVPERADQLEPLGVLFGVAGARGVNGLAMRQKTFAQVELDARGAGARRLAQFLQLHVGPPAG